MPAQIAVWFYRYSTSHCPLSNSRKLLIINKIFVVSGGRGEIASLTFKSFSSNGVAPPPYSNWSLMEPSTGAYPKRLFEALS